MEISVVVAARADDRPPEESLLVASVADRLGYGEVWVGEGPTWDAFALATAIGVSTEQIAITVGPLAVSVRDPASISRGTASVAALTGRLVGVALGTSSKRVVEGVHGRSRAGAVTVLAETTRTLRTFIDTGQIELKMEAASKHFRQRLPPPTGRLTVAAFGDRAIAVAAEQADRMLLDLVSPEQVAMFRAKLHKAALDAGRPPPTLAAWLPAAVEPSKGARYQILRSIAGYLTVRGYAEMFTTAGFGEAVSKAGDGADPEELLAALPPEAAGMVGLVGDMTTIHTRLEAYAAAGLDEVAVVPATSNDAGGERTLTALAELREHGHL